MMQQMMTTDMENYLTTQQAAALLNVSDSRIRQMVLDGVITSAEKIGTMIFMSEFEIRGLQKIDRRAGRPPQAEVSEQALLLRINRYLKDYGEKMRKSRGEKTKQDLGNYYIIDMYRNTLVTSKIYDLESYARKLGVLTPDETMK